MIQALHDVGIAVLIGTAFVFAVFVLPTYWYARWQADRRARRMFRGNRKT